MGTLDSIHQDQVRGLYTSDIQRDELTLKLKTLQTQRETLSTSTELTEIVKCSQIDRQIQELSPIEHAAILIGTFELAHHLERPYRVVINEAVELTKSFGGIDGHKYVNGVLDKLAATLRADEVATRS
jgi:N utilization substance protein B